MRRAGTLLVAAVIVGLVGSAPVTLARFGDSTTTDASFATGSLMPPADLTATGGAAVALAWTPSSSLAAEGYEVLRSATSGSGYGVVGTVTPASAATTTDSPGNGTWYYVLRTYLGSWTSAESNEASATVTTGLTGYQPCTSNVADTGGDGNGYDIDPVNGCLTDGAIARDAFTGTNLVDSCSDAGKDRHQFWGFAFGLPATVTSIDGVALQLVASLNNNGGISRVCAELSWDGGITWTAAQSVALSGTALATYALGSATDTWGRAWTPAELDAANLRLRLTDVSTQPNKTFRLDGVSLQVAYTP